MKYQILSLIQLNKVMDIIKYGKYKGRNLDYVFENDPGYLAWIKAANKMDKFPPNINEYIEKINTKEFQIKMMKIKLNIIKSEVSKNMK